MKTFKIIALSVFMLIGCGFKTHGQIFPSHPELPSYEEARRQKIVYRVADSCLEAAEKLEARGIVYRPKDYFQALKVINLTAKKYDMPVPDYTVSTLRIILYRGQMLMPDDIEPEMAKAHSDAFPHDNQNNIDWLDVLWQFIKFIAYAFISGLLLSFGRIWLRLGLTLLRRLTIKVIRLVREIIISFELVRQNCQFIISELEVEKLFWYRARAPSGYQPDIFKVPLAY